MYLLVIHLEFDSWDEEKVNHSKGGFLVQKFVLFMFVQREDFFLGFAFDLCCLP